jgi:hypothetical protein
MKQKRLLLSVFALVCLSMNNSAWAGDETTNTVTFEDLTLSSESSWYGPAANAVDVTDSYGSAVKSGTFSSNGFSFSNVYNPSWGSWSGFAYSNTKSNSYAGLTDQYHSAIGGGYGGNGNYIICGTSGTITVPATDGQQLSGCYITNNAYAYSSISNGDSYAKKFVQGDYFKVTFTADNGKTQDFYLADFRSTNEADQYIIKDWTWCDLSSLGTVKTLTLSFTSSDNGSWGMNTPAYCCIDNLNGTNTTTGIAPVRKTGTTTSQRYDLNGRAVNGSHKGIVIIRQADGTTKKIFCND